MVLRRFWRNFRVTNRGGILWEESNPKWFLVRALISFSAHISRNNGFTAILTNILPFTKGEVFYEKNQIPNGLAGSSGKNWFSSSVHGFLCAIGSYPFQRWRLGGVRKIWKNFLIGFLRKWAASWETVPAKNAFFSATATRLYICIGDARSRPRRHFWLYRRRVIATRETTCDLITRYLRDRSVEKLSVYQIVRVE